MSGYSTKDFNEPIDMSNVKFKDAYQILGLPGKCNLKIRCIYSYGKYLLSVTVTTLFKELKTKIKYMVNFIYFNCWYVHVYCHLKCPCILSSKTNPKTESIGCCARSSRQQTARKMMSV